MQEKIKEFIQEIWQQQKLWVVLGGVFIFLLLFGGDFLVFLPSAQKEETFVVKEGDIQKTGYLLGDDIDQKAFVGRLEEQYHHIKKQQNDLEQSLEKVNSLVRLVYEKEQNHQKQIEKLKQKLMQTQKQMRRTVKSQPEKALTSPILDIVSFLKEDSFTQEVFLPSGSFVKGILMTGVYAPAEQKNPLPVLIRLLEDFDGPNDTKIPLKGAFVIGKATGDLNSQRALIQAVGLSIVLPDQNTTQIEGNIGYVTDREGQLGIPGQVVHHTGGKMMASFLSGFLSGGASVIANQGVKTFQEEGKTYHQISGELSTRAGFGGLAETARQMAAYYQQQAQDIVPAVMISPGSEVYLVILEGVKIYGLQQAQLLQDDFTMWVD